MSVIGWTTGQIKQFAITTTGSTPPTKDKHNYGGDYFFIKPPDLQNNVIKSSSMGISHRGAKVSRIVPEGTVLVTCIGNLGRVGLSEHEVGFNQQINAITPLEGLLPKYVYYYAQSPYFRNQLESLASSTTIPIVNKGKFSTIVISFPSDDVQERIVAKIDALFSEIDEGIKSLKVSKDAVMFYQQSLLNSLFSENSMVRVGSLLSDVRYGTSKKCGSNNKLTPVLRIPNIIKGAIDTTDLKYAKFDTSEAEKLKLNIGDLLVIRSNGSPSIVGKCAEVTEKDEGYLYAGYLIRLRFDTSVHNAKFYKYLLSSPKLREQIEFKAKSTSGVNNINAEELKDLKVPSLSLYEQNRIVSILDEKSSEVESLEKIIIETTSRLRILKQSVLSKAFNGELI